MAESAFNDPTGAALALALAGVVVTGDASVAGPVAEFAVDLGVSTVIGVIAGVGLSAVSSSPPHGHLARIVGAGRTDRGHDQLLLAGLVGR